MASTDVNIPISAVMSRVTVNVRITGAMTARWRVTAGVKLILLAARVMGCGISIEFPPREV